MGYIYKTVNLINNKLYIGKHSGNFDCDYLGSGLLLKRAIDKHGFKNFKLEVIVYAEDKQKLDELEKQYIKEYRENKHHSEETKKKMRISRIKWIVNHTKENNKILEKARERKKFLKEVK